MPRPLLPAKIQRQAFPRLAPELDRRAPSRRSCRRAGQLSLKAYFETPPGKTRLQAQEEISKGPGNQRTYRICELLLLVSQAALNRFWASSESKPVWEALEAGSLAK